MTDYLESVALDEDRSAAFERDDGQPFSAERLASAARDAGLYLPPSVPGALTAALRAGKHVILTGPPGTGKSTLANLVAEIGREALMCTGVLATTATSAWTVDDTVGTSLDNGEGPVFRPGVVTQAIESGRWLLIDELNRADIDQAFGELFSVLADQAVVLPHRRTPLGSQLSIVPHGVEVPEGTEPIAVPKPWRIIATMNTSDRGLLNTLSRALMRRFAFVHVGTPESAAYERVVAGPGELTARLLAIRELQEIGPAIFDDASDFMAMRLLDGANQSVALLDTFTAYLLPQLEPFDAANTERLLAIMDDLLAPNEQAAVRALLTEFGFELSAA